MLLDGTRALKRHWDDRPVSPEANIDVVLGVTDSDKVYHMGPTGPTVTGPNSTATRIQIESQRIQQRAEESVVLHAIPTTSIVIANDLPK